MPLLLDDKASFCYKDTMSDTALRTGRWHERYSVGQTIWIFDGGFSAIWRRWRPVTITGIFRKTMHVDYGDKSLNQAFSKTLRRTDQIHTEEEHAAWLLVQ